MGVPAAGLPGARFPVTSKRDQRTERTFDRALELCRQEDDLGEVRRQLQAEEARLRRQPEQALDVVSGQQLQMWWEQGLVRQVRLRAVPVRAPIKETIADERRSGREKAKARVPRTFDRAAELLRQDPGQFDRVADKISKEAKARDLEPVDASELRAWWSRGLQEPVEGTREHRQLRPPIKDTVQDHLALQEEQADSEAQTLRRDLKRSAARNGMSAVFTLAIEQEQIRRLRAEMAGMGRADRVGLDKVAVQLMRGIADDLTAAELETDPKKALTPEKRYDWLVKILKLQQALVAAQSAIVQTEALIGGGDRTKILGISIGAVPVAGGPAEGIGVPGTDEVTAEDLRRRALEVAGYMEDLRRLPEGIDAALEAEAAKEV